MSQNRVLNKYEISILDKGRRLTVNIPAHKRRMLRRVPQSIKNRTIHLFAYQWLRQLERYGVEKADKRHAQNLIKLFKQYKLI